MNAVTGPNPPAFRLDVLRRADSEASTRGGVSSRFSFLHLIGWTGWDNATRTTSDMIRAVPGRGAPLRDRDLDAPCVLYVRNIRVCGGPVGVIVPVTYDEATGKWRRPDRAMAGGNFATGGDGFRRLVESRVGLTPFYGALAIHDRIEN